MNSYIPLVEKIAAYHARRTPANIEYCDLESAGYVGLLEALEKRDTKKNFRLYVKAKIRGAILDELRSQSWQTRCKGGQVKMVEYTDQLTVSDGFELIQNRTRLRQVKKAMDGLSERYRDVLTRYYQGQNLGTIAGQYGCSVANVSQLKTAALKGLKKVVL